MAALQPLVLSARAPMRQALVLPLLLGAAVAGRLPRDAQRASTFPRLVAFTLIRGGPDEAAYETFTHSRRCLAAIMPAEIEYDDVAFHEGNVPREIQGSLRQRMPRLGFVDVRDHGGFRSGAQALIPLPNSSRYRDDSDYPIGYRHMVRLRSHSPDTCRPHPAPEGFDTG
eukprot:1640129-Prymnesium_polylepis.3